MTPEELAREEAWVRRMAELEDLYDPGPILAAGGLVLMQKFPIPNTEGMTEAEAETAMARWQADLDAFFAEQRARQAPARS